MWLRGTFFSEQASSTVQQEGETMRSTVFPKQRAMIYKEQEQVQNTMTDKERTQKTKERKLQLIAYTMFYQYDDKASKGEEFKQCSIEEQQ